MTSFESLETVAVQGYFICRIIWKQIQRYNTKTIAVPVALTEELE